MDRVSLAKLNKEELINLVLELSDNNSNNKYYNLLYDEDIERKISEENDAFMERHGYVGYGYGYSCYGAL